MTELLDLAGVGVGPFNLSVAALADGKSINARFFEAKNTFDWHPGLMLPHAYLQTSFLKDLVTPVEPTNPHSFLAYLVSKGRFYSFMNAAQEAITRQEFADYLAWVANNVKTIEFGCPVRSVGFQEDHFIVDTDQHRTRARNLCVGVGKRPYIPECCRGLDAGDCFHAIEMQSQTRNFEGKRVTVVGGGQTGAEIFLHLLNAQWGKPARVNWMSRRVNFLPLDESPFTNELFSPDYVRDFRRLPASERAHAVSEQKLASDGISASTLKAIYQGIYRITHIERDEQRIALLPGRELNKVLRGSDYRLSTTHRSGGENEVFSTDVIILCTGFENALPPCLAGLNDQIHIDEAGNIELSDAFAARWNGPEKNRIYMLNAGRLSHGVAEPQLSLMAWRSARVLNDVMNTPCLPVEVVASPVSWLPAALASEVGRADAALSGGCRAANHPKHRTTTNPQVHYSGSP